MWLGLEGNEHTLSSLELTADATEGCRTAPYVDTHCHLDLVLQFLARWRSAPSAAKRWSSLTAEELRLWRQLGWNSEQWHSQDVLDNPIWFRPWSKLSPQELEAASALGWVEDGWDSFHWLLPKVEWQDISEGDRGHLLALGENPESWEKMLKDPSKKWGGGKAKKNPTWNRKWASLTPLELASASALRWDAAEWDGCGWHLPFVEWSELGEEMRRNLMVLGESAETWKGILESNRKKPQKKNSNEKNQVWYRPWSQLTATEVQAVTALGWNADEWKQSSWHLPDVDWEDLDEDMRGLLTALGETAALWDAGLARGPPRRGAGHGGDWRSWAELTPREIDVASRLGFTAPTWNFQEMADVHGYVRDFCGSGFEGCLTQGCDMDSIDLAAKLALTHPKVFVSFGCHPKTAWEYDDAFEQRLLDAIASCGSKVVAWGEFGLDYSNKNYGQREDYREKQREVFARQLELAIARGLPLVLHIRDAADDALLLIRRHVPRHWKAHVHSFLGGPFMVNALLPEYPNFYYGVTGTVTMGGYGEMMATLVPLEKMLLETDAPCIVPRNIRLSHAGQIPFLARIVARLRGCDAEHVLAIVRANARFIYGF